MEESVKGMFKKGLFWHGTEKILGQGFAFVVGVILARLLSPSDYGLIGMLAIFISLSQQFIDGGFSNALIQKNIRCTNDDYSTAFVVNVIMAIVFYVILYLGAPCIAEFYDEPILCPLARVLGLNFILGSFNIVQIAKLTGVLDFKSLAKIRVSASVISGIIGVGLAYGGMGFWALVGQTLSNTLCCFILYPFFSDWKFSMHFSRQSFKGLFNFGGKLMLSEMLGVIVGGLSSMLIGKFYNSASLGYYTKGNELPSKIGAALSSILGTVTFPVMSTIHEDEQQQFTAYKSALYYTILIISPVFVLMTVLAQPLVEILFTEKWLPCVPLMQFFLLGRMISIVSSIQMTTLKASGHAGSYLKNDIIKAPITVVVLLITLPIGIEAVALGGLCTTIISFFINAYYTSRVVDYGIMCQLKDWRYILLCVCVMCAAVQGFMFFVDNVWWQLLGGVFVGFISFFFTAYLTKVINKEIVLKFIMR